jgi:hypothetical protein
MYRFVSALGAIALAASPALAATSQSPAPGTGGNTPTFIMVQHDNAKATGAHGKPAKVASTSAAETADHSDHSQKPMVRTASATEHHHKARGGSEFTRVASRDIGHREVVALNALERNGYTGFRDLKPEGKMISAVAMKDGKQMQVDVSADGQIKPSI